MALEVEIWKKEIIGLLYKSNEFLDYCVKADEYVNLGKIVHIPGSGQPSNVEIDRTILPATISKRTDTEVTYTLKEFTSDPKLVTNLETLQYSYDKVQSVLREDMATIREKVADWMLRLWSPADAASILRTTGAAVTSAAPGATGNRKGLTKEDLKKARLVMNKQKVLKEGRVALIPSDQMDFLLSDPDLLKRDVSMELDIKGGVITRLYGFDLIERSDVMIYTEAGTPVAKNPGAAGAATDNQATLLWQRDCVERAMGDVKMFYDIDKPEYYGSLFSFLIMMGGRGRRPDGKGVLSIVEASAA
ncbi:phage capsid protein [Dyadobacter frigoris]|uniref:Uncharacterized protein n=1 Tax=Dyadobacter frigoris TaxID=2576211 RepID=A0A4U6D137_9BACT|nr:phage capsid protein [Dyadobacter frigoris]TKT89478.1 hypothetical protein FDK13_24355 [Dyadobacter frigoris]